MVIFYISWTRSEPIKGLGSSVLLALILDSHFGNGLETEELQILCFLMLSLFIYVEFTTSNTRYTTNNIFPTSFKNWNRNLYVNLENSNFMLTTTMHLVLLQNESSNPQNVMLKTQLFQHFVVWDKNSTKRITMFGKQILLSGKWQSVNKESTWHARLILLFSNGNKTTWSKTLKTKVAFEFELVCGIAWLNHYSSEIF